MEKMIVLAPMPSASDRMAANAKPSRARNIRAAYLRSCQMVSMAILPDQFSHRRTGEERRPAVECCDLSQLCSLPMMQSGDKSPHSTGCRLPYIHSQFNLIEAQHHQRRVIMKIAAAELRHTFHDDFLQLGSGERAVSGQ